MERTLDTYYEFTGYRRAAREVDVRAQVTGALKSIHLQEGRLVLAGNVLYQIDPKPHEAALLNADANLAAAAAGLQKLTTDVKTAEERFALAQVEFDSETNSRQEL